MPGGRVPPRTDKRHLHADGTVEEPQPVVHDPERDTSTAPASRAQVYREWPDIAAAHAVDERERYDDVELDRLRKDRVDLPVERPRDAESDPSRVD